MLTNEVERAVDFHPATVPSVRRSLAVVWVVVTVIASALAIALVVQRRHDDDLVVRLTALCGQEVKLCIAPTSSKFAAMGEYAAVIADCIRWVEPPNGPRIGLL